MRLSSLDQSQEYCRISAMRHLVVSKGFVPLAVVVVFWPSCSPSIIDDRRILFFEDFIVPRYFPPSLSEWATSVFFVLAEPLNVAVE